MAADEPNIQAAAQDLRGLGRHVEALEADLATPSGLDRLYSAIGGGRSARCRPTRAEASAGPS